jgi:hypothetical protein
MKLIPEWRKAWRMVSVQAMAVAVAAQGAWVMLPPELQSQVPDWGLKAITASILVLGIVGRLVKQEKVHT